MIFDPIARLEREAGTAEREQAADVARVEAFRRELAERQPGDTSFDVLIAHDEWVAAQNRKIAIAEGVAEASAKRLAEARARLAEAKADAEHAAEEKAAAADERLVREIDTLARKLAAKRDELAASVARTDAYNARRGSRPAIVDAETRVRGTPGRTIPAVHEEREVWRDTEGNTPGQFRHDAAGNPIPADHGTYVKRRERVCVQAERFIGPAMPIRFAKALELVGLDGKSL